MYLIDTFSYLDVQLAMILLFLHFFLQSQTRTGTRQLRVNENIPPEAQTVQSMGHIHDQTKDFACRMSHNTKYLHNRADSGSPVGEDEQCFLLEFHASWFGP